MIWVTGRLTGTSWLIAMEFRATGFIRIIYQMWFACSSGAAKHKKKQSIPKPLPFLLRLGGHGKATVTVGWVGTAAKCLKDVTFTAGTDVGVSNKILVSIPKAELNCCALQGLQVTIDTFRRGQEVSAKH